MLKAEGLWAKGRHADLYDDLTFEAHSGELVLIQADSQLERTAIALTLAGRYKPSGGALEWHHDGYIDQSERSIRHSSELVDSPDITEPEGHMKVRDYVSELVSFSMSAFGRPRSANWLREHDLGDLDNLWIDRLTSEQRTRLVTELAKSNRHARIVVFDSPDRHHNHSVGWIPTLEELAQSEDRERIVIAVVSHISKDWHGTSLVVGDTYYDAHDPQHFEDETAKKDTAEDETAVEEIFEDQTTEDHETEGTEK